MDDPLGDITVRLTVEDYLRVGVFVGQITTQKPNERRTELSPDDRLAFEIAGKLGEVVFSRHFGWPVDWVVRPGGDDWDFELANGHTVDVKSVPVEQNMDYDFGVPIGISRKRFHDIARREGGWKHRGSVEPNVVNRSQLSQCWPECFYS